MKGALLYSSYDPSGPAAANKNREPDGANDKTHRLVAKALYALTVAFGFGYLGGAILAFMGYPIILDATMNLATYVATPALFVGTAAYLFLLGMRKLTRAFCLPS